MLVSAAPTSLVSAAPTLLFSSYLTLALSLPPCPLLHPSFYFNLSARSNRNCLLFPTVLSSYRGSLHTRFSQGTTGPMSWPDREHYLCPLQSPVVSLHLPLASTVLFSWTGGILSYLNFSAQRFPRFPQKNLCSLVMLAVFSFVFAATDTVFCQAFIFLRLVESRILPAVPTNTHFRKPLISFCTVQLQNLCAIHSLATFCLSKTSGPDSGELPSFCGSMVFRHASIPRKWSGNNNNNRVFHSFTIFPKIFV